MPFFSDRQTITDKIKKENALTPAIFVGKYIPNGL